jgi:hypothetical protein
MTPTFIFPPILVDESFLLSYCIGRFPTEKITQNNKIKSGGICDLPKERKNENEKQLNAAENKKEKILQKKQNIKDYDRAWEDDRL